MLNMNMYMLWYASLMLFAGGMACYSSGVHEAIYCFGFQIVVVCFFSYRVGYHMVFSYFLFLLMAGGLLVLFFYVCSMTVSKPYSGGMGLGQFLIFVVLMLSLVSVKDSVASWSDMTKYKLFLFGYSFYGWGKMGSIITLVIYMFVILVLVTWMMEDWTGPFHVGFTG